LKLLDLKNGNIGIIHTITGNKGMRARMAGLGLYEGKRVRVVQTAPFNGPLMIEDVLSGAKVMIARDIASRVIVEDAEPTQ
jgi:Fe2+ transport system protein FeoA